jgi:signal transduction histidine kinase
VQLARNPLSLDLLARNQPVGPDRDVAIDEHRMSYALHPSWLETLGMIAALQSLCRGVSKQRDLHVAFTHRSIPRR